MLPSLEYLRDAFEFGVFVMDYECSWGHQPTPYTPFNIFGWGQKMQHPRSPLCFGHVDGFDACMRAMWQCCSGSLSVALAGLLTTVGIGKDWAIVMRK